MKTTRRSTRPNLIPGICTLLMLVGALASIAAERPNIVVILSDDYGYGSAGCYGANPALVPKILNEIILVKSQTF